MNIIVHVFWSYSTNRFCLNLQEKIIKNSVHFNPTKENKMKSIGG